jgi:hypothetical protein
VPKTEDLRPSEFPELSWTSDDVGTSLGRLYDYVTDQAERARTWYFGKRQWKKIGGYGFRAGAIVSIAAAGLIPILGEIFETGGVPYINPGWATVAVAIGALFVAIDKFAGFTSGWVRYILAGQQLARMEESFRFDWESSKLAWAGAKPSVEQAVAALAQCKGFLEDVNRVVEEETKLWATEFQSALKEIEKAAEATAEVRERQDQ